MKFFSKINNHRVRLTAHVPGNPYMQIAPVYGKSAKFTNGVFETDDQDLIDLMKKHPNFNKDFFASEEDPMKDKRVSSEPVHIIEEVENGRIKKSESSSQKPDMSEKMAEMVKEMAASLLAEGGYVKAEPEPQPMPPQQQVDEEPMDTALADAGESKEEFVPPPIVADSKPEDDDGINPLASTLPPEMQETVPEKEETETTKTKSKGIKAKKTKKS